MNQAVRRLSMVVMLAMAALVPGLALADGWQGLGSAQPTQADISLNPQFHVYEWKQQGVVYVQVNDAAGNVQMALATGGGEVLVLPVGHPELVTVAPAASNVTGDVVHSDASVVIRQVNGAYVVSSAPVAASPTTSATTQSMSQCTNPADCALFAQPLN